MTIERTRKILAESQKTIKTYLYQDKKFLVLPEVFSPAYFADTRWYLEQLLELSGHRVLEAGCGSGVITTMLALQGREVTAVDINPQAVENTKRNLALHSVDGTVLESDLFENVQGTYDLIFFNTPYHGEEEASTMLERAILDHKYESLRRYLCEAPDHLTRQGTALFGFSPTIGNIQRVERIAKKESMSLQLRSTTIQQYQPPIEPLELHLYQIHRK